MREEIEIDKLEKLIDRCNECKFATCENCEINWTEVQAIQGLLDLYKQEKEKNKEYEKQLDLDYVDKNYISKKKIEQKLEHQNMLWNTPNRQKEYNQEVVEVLEELLEEV